MENIELAEHGFFLSMESIGKERLEKYRIPCRSRDILFLLCKAGSLTACINSQPFHVEMRNLVSTIPYDIVRIEECSDDVQCDVLCFHIDFIQDTSTEKDFTPVYCNMIYNHILSLNPMEYELFVEFFVFLRNSFRIMGYNYPQIMKHQFRTMVYGANELYKRRYQSGQAVIVSRARELFYRFLQLVVQYYPQQHKLPFYADKLCITPKYLMACVKECAGVSAATIVNKFILLDATTQLDSTNKSVQQIGYELGFATESSFCKYFRKHILMSPRSYRFREHLDNRPTTINH